MKKLSIKALGLGAALVAATAGSAFAATATTSVNVRSGPGVNYHVVDTLQPGEWVQVNDRAGGWCHVRKAGPDGWVSCRYISGDRWQRAPKVTIRYGTRDYPRDYPRHDRNWDWQDDGYDNGDYYPGDTYPGDYYPGDVYYPSAGVSFGLNLSR